MAALLVAITIAIVIISPVRDWLGDSGHVRQLLDGLGIWALPAFGIAAGALTTIGIPRLLLCGLAAMLFGFWPSLLMMHLASLASCYATFLFVRWGGRGWVLERWPRLRRFADGVRQQGAMGVILARQLPVHGTLINFCLGLSGVRHRHFLIGTAIGLIPEAIPAAMIGAGVVETSGRDMAQYLVLAAAFFALIWIGSAYLIRRSRTSPDAALAQVASYDE